MFKKKESFFVEERKVERMVGLVGANTWCLISSGQILRRLEFLEVYYEKAR